VTTAINRDDIIDIYCDESGTDSGRYLVIGGLWVKRLYHPIILRQLTAFRTKYELTREIKWAKISKGYFNQYKDLLDLYFNCWNRVRFYCIVVEKQKVDWHTYHHNDHELGFYKFYRLLIRYRMSGEYRYYLWADQRNNRVPNRLHTLQCYANMDCTKHIGVSPLVHVQEINSRMSDIMQLSDVLIGAVRACYCEDISGEAKVEFCNYLQSRLGVSSLSEIENKRDALFNIWKWRPKTNMP